MSTEKRNIISTIESTLQCLLVKAEMVGSEELSLKFNVKFICSQPEEFANAVEKGLFVNSEPSGEATLDKIRCECCRRMFKEILTLKFEFSETSDMTCKECGPVRRSARSRSEINYDKGHNIERQDIKHEEAEEIMKKKKSVESMKLNNHNSKSITSKDDEKEISCSSSADLKCEICDDVFCDDASFINHLLKHCGLNSCKCAVCGGKFTNKYVLKKHLKTHVPSERRPFRCDMCNKGFTESFYYRYHLETHSQVKAFKCGQCNRCFSSSTAMRRHIRDHALMKTIASDTPTIFLGKKEDKNQKYSEGVTNTSEAEEKEPNVNSEPESCCTVSHRKVSNLGKVSNLVLKKETESSYIVSGQNSNIEKRCHPDPDNTAYGQVSSQCGTGQLNGRVSELVCKSNLRKKYKCSECDKTFIARPALATHLKLHSTEKTACAVNKILKKNQVTADDRPYPCVTCGKSFFSKQVMEKHTSKHLPCDQWKHECKICNKKFSHISYLQKHALIHNEDNPYECERCGNKFVSKPSLQRHLLSHKTGSHSCSECDKRFTFPHQLKQHMLTHSNLIPFVCKICEKGFKSLQVLRKHHRIHTDAKPFNCEKCTKRFSKKQDLDIHMRVHLGMRPFQCDVCGRTYTTKSSLHHHVITHSEEYNVIKPCQFCGKEFRGDQALSRHLQTHQTEKKCVCELCGKCFASKKALWSHNQTHNGYKPHACKYCTKKFRSITHCKNHMKKHTGENLIQCDNCKELFTDMNYVKKVHPKFCKSRQVLCNICNRAFTHSSALRSHLGYHTGQRPFGCVSCGRAFKSEASLTEHRKRHLEAKSHICKVCGKKCNRAADLKKHSVRHSREVNTKLVLTRNQVHIAQQQLNMKTSISDEASVGIDSGNLISLAGPDTIIEEIHEVSEMDRFPAEHVVLATIDPRSIDCGGDVQYCVSQDGLSELQGVGVLQYHQTLEVVQDHQADIQTRTPDEGVIQKHTTDEGVVLLAVVHDHT